MFLFDPHTLSVNYYILDLITGNYENFTPLIY